MNTTSHLNPAASARFNWKLFGLLCALIVFGFAAVQPYIATLNAGALSQAPLPPLALAILSVVQGSLLFALMAAAGLWAGARTGLGAPILAAWLRGEPVGAALRQIAAPALGLGALAGALLVALDALVFGPLLRASLAAHGVSMPALPSPPAWQGLLASFYGAFNEEIALRLFLLTLLAWLGSRVWPRSDGRPGTGVLWAATLLAALLFGLGHLPATAQAGLPLDAAVVSRALVLNGLVGVLFGWLYWRRGLESAMLAHFAADLVLHVAAPLLLGAL